jgi:hypothetical protein
LISERVSEHAEAHKRVRRVKQPGPYQKGAFSEQSRRGCTKEADR